MAAPAVIADMEWEESLLPPVPVPADLEAYVRRQFGVVPGWLARVAPAPWLARAWAALCKAWRLDEQAMAVDFQKHVVLMAVGHGGQVLLALRGSGQALYVGLADDAYVVASEPYGLVEETANYIRMDGETPANLENPNASRGQVLILDGDHAGTIDGIRRLAYDGTELPVTDADINTAQITTRDIDRGPYPHFLLK